MSRVIAAVVCILIVGAFGFWIMGREDRLKDEINRRDTLERMDNATDPDLDDNAVNDSLRDHAKP